ncbi:MAG: lipopolysaccharide assembly protein LapA domain-containing protein [Clostridiaceae bacterium]
MSQDLHQPGSETNTDSRNNIGGVQAYVQDKSTKGIRISWQLIAGLVLLAIAIVFAAINTQKVILNLLFTKLEAPMIVIILCSVCIGVIVTLLAGWRRRRKKAKK